ncbi:hypothetical protein EJ03DRAFT_168763 [Teratosphaeria nubilosa]|uniref:Uncharacterized protein n=1 Tax=Teratosphaeria nubilosa TaxID=161662 RepID=A0A6G1LIH4_9PEZI|nr:hypothetical protein EJ03DRAFT_168763 [Teratosphaeria nubilosa]
MKQRHQSTQYKLPSTPLYHRSRVYATLSSQVRKIGPKSSLSASLSLSQISFETHGLLHPRSHHHHSPRSRLSSSLRQPFSPLDPTQSASNPGPLRCCSQSTSRHLTSCPTISHCVALLAQALISLAASSRTNSCGVILPIPSLSVSATCTWSRMHASYQARSEAMTAATAAAVRRRRMTVLPAGRKRSKGQRELRRRLDLRGWSGSRLLVDVVSFLMAVTKLRGMSVSFTW